MADVLNHSFNKSEHSLIANTMRSVYKGSSLFTHPLLIDIKALAPLDRIPNRPFLVTHQYRPLESGSDLKLDDS